MSLGWYFNEWAKWQASGWLELSNIMGLTVKIVVNDQDCLVRPGKWVVRALKKNLGIDAAKVLARIKPTGLEDFLDGATVTIGKGEHFMTHARAGGSS